MRCLVALTAALLVTTACSSTNTGVSTSPTFVPAQRVPPPQELAPPDQAPEPVATVRGANAVHASMKGVRVQPTNLDMVGNTWRIHDVDQQKIYVVPTAPLSPTTILFPPQETLTSAVSGATEDFTIKTAVSGTRAAITVMPNCASPHTTRFAADSETPLGVCRSDHANATFLTSGGHYSFMFVVYDWTAAAIVEVNHAPPPRTNLTNKGRPPFPTGKADALQIKQIGDWKPAWTPQMAYADSEKMVIRFEAPLPVLPGLYAGMKGEQVVNYSTVETDDGVFIVTNRRVTEAELRIDDQIVRITSGRTDELRADEEPRRRLGSAHEREAR